MTLFTNDSRINDRNQAVEEVKIRESPEVLTI